MRYLSRQPQVVWCCVCGSIGNSEVENHEPLLVSLVHDLLDRLDEFREDGSTMYLDRAVKQVESAVYLQPDDNTTKDRADDSSAKRQV